MDNPNQFPSENFQRIVAETQAAQITSELLEQLTDHDYKTIEELLYGFERPPRYLAFGGVRWKQGYPIGGERHEGALCHE